MENRPARSRSVAWIIWTMLALGCDPQQATPQEPPQDPYLQQVEREDTEGLFPRYLIHARPTQPERPVVAPQAEGDALISQIRRSYPRHTSFQLVHELVERQEDPTKVVEYLALKKDWHVADIGCGSGFFTSAFAKLVGSGGKVYALDIQEVAVQYLRERLLERPELDPYGNIVIIQNPADDITLAPGSLDAGLFSHADFYMYEHLLPENTRMLESLLRAFKSGGRLVIVQYLGLDRGTSGENIERNLSTIGFLLERKEFDAELNVWYGSFRTP